MLTSHTWGMKINILYKFHFIRKEMREGRNGKKKGMIQEG